MNTNAKDIIATLENKKEALIIVTMLTEIQGENLHWQTQNLSILLSTLPEKFTITQPLSIKCCQS